MINVCPFWIVYQRRLSLFPELIIVISSAISLSSYDEGSG